MLIGRKAERILEELKQLMADCKEKAEQSHLFSESAFQTSEEVKKLIRKQSLELEDFIEEAGDATEKSARLAGEVAELRKQKEELLKLASLYINTFRTIRNGLKDENWQAQLEIMDDKLRAAELSCHIERIDQEDQKIDYERHEVLSVIPAEAPEYDKTIAKLYRAGLCCDDLVKEKALVSVFSYPPEGSQNE